ncbi:signal peptidase II [Rappaport israeli]|uniref:signal peptidase II n=1 Tax=Rappaport israeli TaxID=1839807 RepID=UPI000A677AFF
MGVFGLCLYCWGALGNALDRSGLLDESALGAMIGHVDNPSPAYVIDFIQWHYQDWYWPVFNVADVAITLGVGCLFVHLFLQDKKQAEAQGE